VLQGNYSSRVSRRQPTLAHGLTYGVELLPLHPLEAARTGATARIPLVIGSNRREASLFARDKTPMLPTTQANVDRYFARFPPEARARVLAAYRSYPRRRALEAIGADAMFVAPTWAFTDAYSAHAPAYAYRFDHTPATLRAWVWAPSMEARLCNILHSYGSHLGRRLHPLGRWLTPAVGRRMQRTWLQFADATGSDSQPGRTIGRATTPRDGRPALSGRSPMSWSTTPMRPAARPGT